MKRFQKLFVFPMGVPSSCVLIWIIVFFCCFFVSRQRNRKENDKVFYSWKDTLIKPWFLLKHSSALLLFPYSAFCYHQFLKTLTQVVFSTKIVGFINVLFIYLFIFLILSIYLPMYLSASLPIYQSMYLLIYQAFCLSIYLSVNLIRIWVYLLISVST